VTNPNLPTFPLALKGVAVLAADLLGSADGAVDVVVEDLAGSGTATSLPRTAGPVVVVVECLAIALGSNFPA
jgi:hypothetical protein